MKVKIGEVVYDSEEIPIVISLSNKEKEHITNMAVNDHKYCSFPFTTDIQHINEFIKDERL